MTKKYKPSINFSTKLMGHSQCTICLEPIKNRNKTILGCGHIFHFRCLSEWFCSKSNHDSCPICRQDVNIDIDEDVVYDSDSDNHPSTPPNIEQDYTTEAIQPPLSYILSKHKKPKKQTTRISILFMSTMPRY